MRRPILPWDVWLWSLLLAALSAPLLLVGRPPLALVYAPAAVARGEWWRLLTHPFVHVSRYHLLLDGAAFLSLLAGLSDLRPRQRLSLVLGSGAASLMAASLLPHETSAFGLCGLSGIGHGLMAATAFLMTLQDEAALRRLGFVVLALVATKALLEAATGHLLLELVHFGDLGRPNRLCHLGGLLGGLLVARRLSLPAPRGDSPQRSRP